VRAVDSERFFCIQACDLLAGLALGALRAIGGSLRAIDQDKLAMLDTWVDLSKPRAEFLRFVHWDGAEVQPRQERKKFHIELEFLLLT